MDTDSPMSWTISGSLAQRYPRVLLGPGRFESSCRILKRNISSELTGDFLDQTPSQQECPVKAQQFSAIRSNMAKNKQRVGRGSSFGSSPSGSLASQKPSSRGIVFPLLIVVALLATLVALATVARQYGEADPKRNAFTARAVPLSTPEYAANAPAKEYVYAGSKLIAVTEPVQPAPNDLAVWRLTSGSGTWYVLGDGGTTTQTWGQTDDLPSPGDFDGDGKTDFCVFRPSNGNWYMIESATSKLTTLGWGQQDDIPVPADFDGDSRADLALYRPSNQTWYIKHIASGNTRTQQYGNSTDKPLPSDFDGDEKADIALWRDSNATWYVWQSSANSGTSLQFGASGDKPVPGDYDGDLKTDHAVWKANDTWVIRYSSTSSSSTLSTWGYQSSDIAVQGDYDSDGKTDRAIWRPSTGYWYIIKSSNSNWRVQQWGQSGDVPVPAPYRR